MQLAGKLTLVSARSETPPGATQPLIKPRSIDDVPILALTFSSDRYGPLELRFQDAQGRQLGPANFVRAGLNGVPSGRWSWWVSMPWVAPAQATAMRLRFGQELKADAGGWGQARQVARAATVAGTWFGTGTTGLFAGMIAGAVAGVVLPHRRISHAL